MKLKTPSPEDPEFLLGDLLDITQAALRRHQQVLLYGGARLGKTTLTASVEGILVSGKKDGAVKDLQRALRSAKDEPVLIDDFDVLVERTGGDVMSKLQAVSGRGLLLTSHADPDLIDRRLRGAGHGVGWSDPLVEQWSRYCSQLTRVRLDPWRTVKQSSWQIHLARRLGLASFWAAGASHEIKATWINAISAVTGGLPALIRPALRVAQTHVESTGSDPKVLTERGVERILMASLTISEGHWISKAVDWLRREDAQAFAALHALVTTGRPIDDALGALLHYEGWVCQDPVQQYAWHVPGLLMRSLVSLAYRGPMGVTPEAGPIDVPLWVRAMPKLGSTLRVHFGGDGLARPVDVVLKAGSAAVFKMWLDARGEIVSIDDLARALGGDVATRLRPAIGRVLATLKRHGVHRAVENVHAKGYRVIAEIRDAGLG